jgi:hypothetical protein
MYTFLSQLPTAMKSLVGENCKSDMLSVGTCPCGTSTSLLVSPVVELAAAAGALEPKRAIAMMCRGAQVGGGEVVGDVSVSRGLLVMPRRLGAKVREFARYAFGVAVEEWAQMNRCSYVEPRNK